MPKSAPIYADALAGALNFQLTMGEVDGKKALRWSGVYLGRGGTLGGKELPPSDCDNFWLYK